MVWGIAVAVILLAFTVVWVARSPSEIGGNAFTRLQFETPPRSLNQLNGGDAQGYGLTEGSSSGNSSVQFVWNQRQAIILPNPATLEALLGSGKGWMLESLLTADHRRELSAHLAAVTETLSELAVAYEKEIRRIKRSLVGDENRTIVIRTQPREQDPNYESLLSARALTEGTAGGVWGDYVDGVETHFIVRWADWPDLKEVRHLQLSVISHRNQLTADWIHKKYQSVGPALFLNRS
jgi:hypothetical protein